MLSVLRNKRTAKNNIRPSRDGFAVRSFCSGLQPRTSERITHALETNVLSESRFGARDYSRGLLMLDKSLPELRGFPAPLGMAAAKLTL